MKSLVTHLIVTFVLVASVAASGPQVMRRVEPQPLDANDPLAVRSAALVKQLLAGEKDAAIALLKKEGDEEYVKSGKLETDVDAQIKRLTAGKYKIKEFEKGFGTDVVVFMTNDKGEEGNLVIRYNGDKKITGFAEAKINR